MEETFFFFYLSTKKCNVISVEDEVQPLLLSSCGNSIEHKKEE